MARNKHPEETVHKILEVSTKLFLEQGYENTSIQNIVDALGMSKGAIYHHFKSKEEILTHLTLDYYNDDAWFLSIQNNPALSGLEKLRQMFFFQLSDQKKLDMDHISVSLMKNPKMLMMFLTATIEQSGPPIAAVIREGNADGSLSVAQPLQTAEAVLLLVNLWLGAFSETKEAFMDRTRFLKEMTDKLGLPLLDDQLLHTCEEYFDRVIQS